ncbi:MAG: hypothetical protein OXL37_17740 [Chloroflexota bacterium]|nr:hypothetical protein [Chloroflexota bacterium]MDE2958813.1 hypothetical protein [Chloroflexota bacterium]
MNSATATGNAVVVTVELFGMARVHAGVNSFDLAVEDQASIAALLDALAEECPRLMCNVLCRSDDGAVTVAEGYALNRNGLAFLSPDMNGPLDWRSGESLLLLSNQAGG